eukprot:m.367036 g.367036  ORF g.367036 m.367036 type:complete len:362 (-) comp16662_c0_seq2:143-1228(-)
MCSRRGGASVKRPFPRAQSQVSSASIFGHCTMLPNMGRPTSGSVLSIFGYYQAGDEDFHVVPITNIEEVNARTLARLYFTMTWFAFNLTLERLPSREQQRLKFAGTGGNIEHDNHRLKVLNYAGFKATEIENGGRGEISQEDRRTFDHAKQMLQGAKKFEVSRSIEVLCYPTVAGSHKPCHTNCVATVVKHLKVAHDRGILHCDLRVANCIFNPEDVAKPADSRKSAIIDWDHARDLQNPGRYVSNWNGELRERHPDARAGNLIKMEHERHSLQHILALCRPDVEGKYEEWAAVCKYAGETAVDLDLVASRIEAMDCSLTLKEDFEDNETGSPSRQNHHAKKTQEDYSGHSRSKKTRMGSS